MKITVSAYINSLIKSAVEDWFVRQCHDPACRMFVFYRPTDGERLSKFHISATSPGSEWEFVTAEVVRTDLTIVQVQRWIYSLSGSLRLLPVEMDFAP